MQRKNIPDQKSSSSKYKRPCAVGACLVVKEEQQAPWLECSKQWGEVAAHKSEWPQAVLYFGFILCKMENRWTFEQSSIMS